MDNDTGKPVLNSWKEIATYLQRDVSTVRRWEKREGLPVHRHEHQERSSVYAYPSELDAWRAARQPEAVRGLPWTRWAIASAVVIGVLGSAAAAWRVLLPRLPYPLVEAAEAGGATTLRKVWAGNDVDISGTISADGRYLSFIDWTTGDVAIRDLASGKNRRITNKGPWGESLELGLFPRISPDGSQVAYTWMDRGYNFAMRVAGLDGAPPRELYRNPETPFLIVGGWSPDGNQIAVTLHRQDQTRQIALISAASGAVRVLKTVDWREPGNLAFSPDGEYLLYDFQHVAGSPKRDLFVLAVDGSSESRAVEHPAHETVLGWTPDGKRILFTSDRAGTADAWELHVAGGAPQGSPELMKKDLGRVTPMGMTREGLLYYGVGVGDRDVYTAQIDLQEGKLTGPAVRVATAFVGSNNESAWSPDGKWLAWLSTRVGHPLTIGSRVLCLRHEETGEQREWPVALGYVRDLGWSADSRSVLVTARDQRQREGRYALDPGTGRIELERQRPPVATSLDGRTVFLKRVDFREPAERRGMSVALVARDVEKGTERQLFRDFPEEPIVGDLNGGGIGDSAVSPDGESLAFVYTDSRSWSSLRVVSTAGGAVREILRTGATGMIAGYGRLAWSPDGRQILLVRLIGEQAREDAERELWSVPVDGGEPRSLGFKAPRLREIRLHPNGKQVTFSSGVNRGEVWVMETAQK